MDDLNLHDWLHYEPETGEFYWKQRVSRAVKAGMETGRKGIASRYLKIKLFGQMYSAHRLAWFLYYGEWPADQIDHINRDKHDNRISNLRAVSARVNNQNKLEFKGGVILTPSNKWLARASVNNERMYIGVYDTQEKAIDAYTRYTKENT